MWLHIRRPICQPYCDYQSQRLMDTCSSSAVCVAAEDKHINGASSPSGGLPHHSLGEELSVGADSLSWPEQWKRAEQRRKRGVISLKDGGNCRW